MERWKVYNEPQTSGDHRRTGKGLLNHFLVVELDSDRSQEMTSIDNIMKAKLNNYNLAKGQLVQIQRKKA